MFAPTIPSDSHWWRAASRGQLQRIGLGVAGILLIAAYVWADGALEASGRQSEIQAAADATDRSEELGAAPAISATPGSTDSDVAAGSPSFSAAQPAEEASLAAPTADAAPAGQGQSTPAPVAAPTSPPTPVPTPTPSPLPTTVLLEGIGSAITEPFAYPGGGVRVHALASARGAGCYYIGTFTATDPALLPVDASLRTTVLFLEGAGSAEGWVDLTLAPGSYYMEIDSDCAWTVTVAPG